MFCSTLDELKKRFDDFLGMVGRLTMEHGPDHGYLEYFSPSGVPLIRFSFFFLEGLGWRIGGAAYGNEAVDEFTRLLEYLEKAPAK